MDGEIVALDAQGSPSFQALQHRGSHPGHQIVFYAFDRCKVSDQQIDGAGKSLELRFSRDNEAPASQGVGASCLAASGPSVAIPAFESTREFVDAYSWLSVIGAVPARAE